MVGIGIAALGLSDGVQNGGNIRITISMTILLLSDLCDMDLLSLQSYCFVCIALYFFPVNL